MKQWIYMHSLKRKVLELDVFSRMRHFKKSRGEQIAEYETFRLFYDKKNRQYFILYVPGLEKIYIDEVTTWDGIIKNPFFLSYQADNYRELKT